LSNAHQHPDGHRARCRTAGSHLPGADRDNQRNQPVRGHRSRSCPSRHRQLPASASLMAHSRIPEASLPSATHTVNVVATDIHGNVGSNLLHRHSQRTPNCRRRTARRTSSKALTRVQTSRRLTSHCRPTRIIAACPAQWRHPRRAARSPWAPTRSQSLPPMFTAIRTSAASQSPSSPCR